MCNSSACVISSIILFIMGLFKRTIPQEKNKQKNKTKTQGSLVYAVSDLYSIFHWKYSVLTGSQLNIKCLRGKMKYRQYEFPLI